MSRSIEESSWARIVVIGDIHGYRDPLERLLGKIDPGDGDLLVFIGDYVDRGPYTRACVDLLVEVKAQKSDTVFLKGNHEDMLLGSIGMPALISDMRTWLYNGGDRTLASYGATEREIRRLRGAADEEERKRIVLGRIPQNHIEFFLDLELYVETDRFFICHAGVSPAATIEEGKENLFDLLWTRDHFLHDEQVWEKTVVCGHTPQKEVLVRRKLICVDTGLYYYGTLSAIDLLSGGIYQVRRDRG